MMKMFTKRNQIKEEDQLTAKRLGAMMKMNRTKKQNF
jgi:hypothetical protein